MKKLGILDQDQAVEFLRRSYKAVDGLWFMMLEKASDFDAALKIDKAVWEVLPRIQVKKIKELTGIVGDTARDFLPVLETKFALEEYEYKVTAADRDALAVEITRCPWVELLRKSNRLHLAEKIAAEICTVDLAGWSRSFSPDLEFSFQKRDCLNSRCSFCFKRN